MRVALKRGLMSSVSLRTCRVGFQGRRCNYDYMTASEADEKLRGWFSGRLPEGWFEGPPEVVHDREEITVIGTLPALSVAEGAPEAERAEAIAGQIQRFREDTRERRIAIAREAEHRFGRKVSWGVESTVRLVDSAARDGGWH